MSNKEGVGKIAGLALILAGWAAAGVGTLQGQDFLARPADATAPVPAAPFVRQAEPAAYAVSFAYPGLNPISAAAKADFRDARLDVEKLGPVRHEIRHRGSGEAVETWYVNMEQISTRNPFGVTIDRPMFYAASINGALSFPELSWVNAESFTGVIRAGQQVIDVYSHHVDDAVGAEPFLFRAEAVTAYVDDETRLPLALKTNAYTAAYVFRDAPAQLAMPPAYQAAYDDYRRRTGTP